MRRQLQWMVLATLGCVVLHVAVTDLHLRYVQPFMRPFLILTGAVLVLLGVLDLFRGITGGHHHGGHDDGQAGHGHSHDAAPRSTWLLLVPVLFIGALTPPALGAYSAERAVDVSGVDSRTEEEVAAGFEPLPPDEVLTMPLGEFSARAHFDASASLTGRTVRLLGFVTSPEGPDWELSRMSMMCCAADAVAIQIRVTGRDAPPSDQWVTVEGTWVPDDASVPPGSQLPHLKAAKVLLAPAPRNPYE